MEQRHWKPRCPLCPGTAALAAARSMHFDFRLEADGVLKSFAVPKGPSKDPHDKRFATPTEDHPLEYRDFEGVIPKGEYGGGTVIVWDEGTYRNLSSGRDGREIPLTRALEQGHASFSLHGRKLYGGKSRLRPLSRLDPPRPAAQGGRHRRIVGRERGTR